MRTIEVTISPTGETHLETRGFQGRSCLEASRPLEAAVGRSVADRLTAEYYQSALETARIRAQDQRG